MIVSDELAVKIAKAMGMEDRTIQRIAQMSIHLRPQEVVTAEVTFYLSESASDVLLEAIEKCNAEHIDTTLPPGPQKRYTRTYALREEGG